MRNLLEFPIDGDEVNALLQNLIDRHRMDGTIGSTDGLILYALMKTLEDREIMEKVLSYANPDAIP